LSVSLFQAQINTWILLNSTSGGAALHLSFQAGDEFGYGNGDCKQNNLYRPEMFHEKSKARRAPAKEHHS